MMSQYEGKGIVEYLTLIYHSHATQLDKSSSFTELYEMTIDL